MIKLNLKSYSYSGQTGRAEKRLKKVLLEKQKVGEFRTTMFFFKNAKKKRFKDIKCNPTQLASQMDRIITTLNRKFGNRWEIHLEPTWEQNSSGDYVYKGLEIHVMIHYPSFYISNEEGLSREIKDLIVTFRIISNNESPSQLTVTRPRGCRATLDFDEWFSAYQHSHLRKSKQESYSKCFNTIDFCIGTGTEIDELLVDMWVGEYEFSDIMFESYLYALDSLLEWESLEGVPWAYLKDVVVGSNTFAIPRTYNKSEIKNFFNNFKNKLTSHSLDNIDFVLSEGRYVIKNNVKFKKFLKEIILRDESLSRGLLYVEEGNYYYGYSQIHILSENSLNDKFKNEEGEKPAIFIQGNKLEFNVLPFEGEIENVDGYKVHPNIIEYAKEQLEQKLFLQYIRKSTIEKYYQTNNT